MNWKDVREEYSSLRIGPLILELVHESVRRVTRRGYNARVYALGKDHWDDDALQELVQEVVLHVLLEGGQLDYMMTMGSLDDCKGILDYQVRRQLGHRRHRTIIDNLLDRCRAILERSPFASSGSAGLRAYRLSQRAVEPRRPTDEERRAAALAIVYIPRIPHRSGDRAPTVYSENNLQLALETVASTLPCEFGVSDLDRILREILTFWLPSFLPPPREEEGEELSVQELGPEDMAIARDTARNITEKLSIQEARILAMKMAGMADGDIAQAVGLSRPTVAKRRTEIMRGLGQELAGLPTNIHEATFDELAARLAEKIRDG
jgi:hypothetical protein